MPEITATWAERDIDVIYAACGIKWPQHPTDKKGKVLPPVRRIGEFDAPEYKDLEKMLIKIQKQVGIKQLLDHDDNDTIMMFLRREFPDFNIFELQSAFLLADGGHLNIVEIHGGQQIKSDTKHYGEFTCAYLKKILTPYRQYRAKVINRHLDEEMAMVLKMMDSEQPAETPEQKLLKDKQFLISAYNNYTTGLPIYGLNRLYDMLNQRGIVNFTTDLKQKFKTQAVQKLTTESKKDPRIKSIVQAFNKGLQIGKNSVIQEAKKLAVM